MKRIGLIIGGVCGFVCAFGFALLLLAYLSGGSGGQFIGLPPAVFGDPVVSSGSIFIGLVHTIGLAAASFFCFTVGVGFCVHGIVPEQASGQVTGPQQRPGVNAAVNRTLHSGVPTGGASGVGRFTRTR